jgi:hypothetical protein
MANCKQCGTKCSIWSSRPDGLCKDCGAKADESAKQEAERKEAERKQQVLEESKRNIELILRGITTEPPLSFTFINWGIEEKKKGGGLLGVVVGGALGGMVGAMIGGALTPSSCSYTGNFGVLVLTQTQIIIGHFASPFQSGDGKIISDHLGLIRAQLDAGTLTRQAFNISKTQLSQSPVSSTVTDLVCGADRLSFQKSELYVNDALYEVPSTAEIQNRVAQMGTLATPSQFVAKLLAGEKPVPEGQFVGLETKDKYASDVFMAIVKHPNRDKLVQNFPCLAPSVRAALEEHIRSRGATSGNALVKLLVWIVLAIAGIAGIVVAEDFLCFLSVVWTIIAAIVSITAAVNLSRATWCRDTISRK